MPEQGGFPSWVAGLSGRFGPSRTDLPAPPFDSKGCRHDQNTYFGRLLHFQELTHPASLLTSGAQLEAAQALLARHARGEAKGASDAELWEAKRVKDAVLHPVTGEEMLLPGRMSAFVPMNTIFTAAMLLARSPAAIMASQWGNQTANSMTNYVNRGGAEIDTGLLAKAYAAAVVTGCGIGVGMRRLVERGPSFLARLGLAVPYTAVVAAGAANVALTRMPEMLDGVPISAPDGTPLGLSKAAAVASVKQTILSRVTLLPAPVMLGPPLVLAALQRAVPRLPKPLAVVAETTLVSLTIFLALPPAIAMFPQEMRIPADALEPEFRDRLDGQGRRIESVTCNKGL